MKIVLAVTLFVVLSSCTTVSQQPPIMQCSIACGSGQMYSYEIHHGKCTCLN